MRTPAAREKPELESATRRRVIEAAIDAICEHGYYRASSNEIAKRAGVTWGVIQYHFGTREQLLLAVIDSAIADVTRRLEEVPPPQGPFRRRFDAWCTLIFDYFGAAEYTAVLQIIWNLSRDPSTGAATTQALERYEGVLNRLYERAAAVGDTAPASDLADFIMWSTWSLAALESSIQYMRGENDPRAQARRECLASALEALTRQAGRRKNSR